MLFLIVLIHIAHAADLREMFDTSLYKGVKICTEKGVIYDIYDVICDVYDVFCDIYDVFMMFMMGL